MPRWLFGSIGGRDGGGVVVTVGRSGSVSVNDLRQLKRLMLDAANGGEL